MTRRLKTIENKRERPATVGEIAALEFAAVKEYRGLTKTERLRKLHGSIDNIRPLAVLSCEIAAMEKSELIRKVHKNYDQFGPLLMQLSHANDTTRALMELIATAEVRLAVALANVEGNDSVEEIT